MGVFRNPEFNLFMLNGVLKDDHHRVDQNWVPFLMRDVLDYPWHRRMVQL